MSCSLFVSFIVLFIGSRPWPFTLSLVFLFICVCSVCVAYICSCCSTYLVCLFTSFWPICCCVHFLDFLFAYRVMFSHCVCPCIVPFAIAAAGAVLLFHPQTKTNCEDAFPNTSSTPKTNCEDEVAEAKLPPEAEFLPKTNCEGNFPKTNPVKLLRCVGFKSVARVFKI